MFGLETLEGKSVWLTGASGGLGAGIARHLAGQGFRLGLHYHRHRERAKQLAGELTRNGADVALTGGDLAAEGVAREMVTRLRELQGPPYALVHLAGPYIRKPVIDHTREEFDTMLAGNLTSFFEAVRAVVPLMREAGTGRIVVFAMAGAHITVPMRNTGPHLAAKAGIVALARTLALEEAGQGITVNVISPGHIPHKELDRAHARREEAGPAHPMGVHGSYEDLADAILYLLSPAASYVTGAVLEVTGGWMGDDWHPGGHSH